MLRFSLALLFVLATGLSAHALDAPKGPVILTVKGRLAHPNRGADAVFDRAMLEAIAGRTAKVETPWTKEPATYTGPYLRAVLAAAGAGPGAIRITALNDYAATLPATDASDLDTILALSQDGKPMTVRDKGPLMVIYPFDKDRSLMNETYFSRSIWQISTIEVQP